MSSNADQPIKKFLQIVNESIQRPDAAPRDTSMDKSYPNRANCIAKLKGLDYATQLKTINRWFDTKKIGHSLYNDLMQYVRTNDWSRSTNRTTEEGAEDNANGVNENSSDDLVGGEWGTPEQQAHLPPQIKADLDKRTNYDDKMALIYTWIRRGDIDRNTFKSAVMYVKE